MWTVGYIVAPTLFAMLADRTMAGSVAGQLFSVMSYVGLLAAGLLISGQCYRSRATWRQNWRFWTLLIMLLIIVIGEFYLQPLMAELKLAGLREGRGSSCASSNSCRWMPSNNGKPIMSCREPKSEAFWKANLACYGPPRVRTLANRRWITSLPTGAGESGSSIP